VAMGTKKIF